jgi:hypothetical protein
MNRDSVVIRADLQRSVNIDQFDGKIWLSISVNGGSAYCTVPKDEAIRMISVLQEFVNELEEV